MARQSIAERLLSSVATGQLCYRGDGSPRPTANFSRSIRYLRISAMPANRTVTALDLRRNIRCSVWLPSIFNKDRIVPPP